MEPPCDMLKLLDSNGCGITLKEVEKTVYYENMSYGQTAVFCIRDGKWELTNGEEFKDFSGSFLKITKEWFSPQIKIINNGGVFYQEAKGYEVEKRTRTSGMKQTKIGGGYDMKFTARSMTSSSFYAHVGAGISSEYGIIDDSIAAKVYGCGFKIGRRVEISVLDNTVSADLYDMTSRLWNWWWETKSTDDM